MIVLCTLAEVDDLMAGAIICTADGVTIVRTYSTDFPWICIDDTTPGDCWLAIEERDLPATIVKL